MTPSVHDIVYSDNMAAIAPIRTAKGALSPGVSGACSLGKFFKTSSLRCNLVYSGRLNLANAWITY